MDLTDRTWNPATGCTKVSPGCAWCYIERQTPMRVAGRKFVKGDIPIVLHPERLDKPLRWRDPCMIFVNSMSDLFHEDIPREFIDRVFATMALATQHTFQVLTKRPDRMLAYFKEGRPWDRVAGRVYEHNTYSSVAHEVYSRERWPLPNVWLGVTIESARFTWRADVLRATPAAVRFISAEPLLGSLFPFVSIVGVLCPECDADADTVEACTVCHGSGAGRVRAPLNLHAIDWLIAGGESGGRGVRMMHPQWARELRDACAEKGTAYFFKQWGSWEPSEPGAADVVVEPDGSRRRVEDALPSPQSVFMRYAGAAPKSGGKLLDGEEWCEMPGGLLAPA